MMVSVPVNWPDGTVTVGVLDTVTGMLSGEMPAHMTEDIVGGLSVSVGPP